MSNQLTDARISLAEAITAATGLRCVTEIPQNFSPPLCWIAPRQPYRQAARTQGQKRISFGVVCLAANGTNAQALAQTEDMAWTVANAIEQMRTYRLDSEEIDAAQMFPTAMGQDMLGAVVNCWIDVPRG